MIRRLFVLLALIVGIAATCLGLWLGFDELMFEGDPVVALYVFMGAIFVGVVVLRLANELIPTVEGGTDEH